MTSCGSEGTPSRMKYRCSKSAPKPWCCPPAARIHRSEDLAGKQERSGTYHHCLFKYTRKMFAFHPCDFRPYWSRGLSAKGRNTSTKDSKWFTQREAEAATWLLWLLIPRAKKGVTRMAGVPDFDHQGQTGLILHKESKGKYILKVGDLGHLLVFSWPMIKVNDKLQQLKARLLINSLDLWMRAWAHSTRQEGTMTS